MIIIFDETAKSPYSDGTVKSARIQSKIPDHEPDAGLVQKGSLFKGLVRGSPVCGEFFSVLCITLQGCDDTPGTGFRVAERRQRRIWRGRWFSV